MSSLLIDQVRKRPALWDCTTELFRDKNIKELAWQEIADVLQKPIADLKLERKRLRDCHRNAMKRKETKSGQAATNVKPWKYEKHMEFLVSTAPPHVPQESNIPPLMDESNEGQQQPNIEDDSNEDVTDDEQPTRLAGSQKEPSGRQRSPRGVDKVIHFMKEKNKPKNTRPAPDDIDLFFGSAALSVKKLPRLLQIRVKRQVLDAISRAEEENEFSVSPSPSETSTRSSTPGGSNSNQTSLKRFKPINKPSSLSETGALLREFVNTPNFYPDNFEENYSVNTDGEYH